MASRIGNRAVGWTRNGMAAYRTRISARMFSQAMVARSEGQIAPLSTFTEEEDMMREVVSKLAREVIQPKVYEMDENENMDKGIIQNLFEQGLMGIETPGEMGGAEASFTSAIIVIEELAKVDPAVSVMCDVQNTLVNTLIRKYASKELQEKYLPQLATEKLGSFCLSEPVSGSDAFALKSRAEKKDGKYVLNGSKMWITNGAEAEIFLIFANLDPSKGYKGITCFLAEKEWGVKVAKKEKKLGIRASSTAVITFDDLEIPAENLLGKEGEGYKYAIEILNEGRIGIAAQMNGLAMGVFDKAMPYILNERKQFGQAIGDFQGMRFLYAQCATEIEASRLLTYNAARLKEAGKPFVKEAAMAKWYASQVAQRVAGQSIEFMGGMGFTREMGIEKYWRDSKIGAIYEGTSNIQLDTIARYLKKEYQN